MFLKLGCLGNHRNLMVSMVLVKRLLKIRILVFVLQISRVPVTPAHCSLLIQIAHKLKLKNSFNVDQEDKIRPIIFWSLVGTCGYFRFPLILINCIWLFAIIEGVSNNVHNTYVYRFCSVGCYR
ncbi:uncharacterized protein DS421_8g224160 [Arachis hypogaea]|nr:uncharacterized protein DS421_8g224160 [Arachis hypogaea]